MIGNNSWQKEKRQTTYPLELPFFGPNAKQRHWQHHSNPKSWCSACPFFHRCQRKKSGSTSNIHHSVPTCCQGPRADSMLTEQFLGSYPAKSYAFAFVLSIIHLHCEILPETVLDLVGCCEVVFFFSTNSEIILRSSPSVVFFFQNFWCYWAGQNIPSL